jgi:hypothetical protein
MAANRLSVSRPERPESINRRQESVSRKRQFPLLPLAKRQSLIQSPPNFFQLNVQRQTPAIASIAERLRLWKSPLIVVPMLRPHQLAARQRPLFEVARFRAKDQRLQGAKKPKLYTGIPG